MILQWVGLHNEDEKVAKIYGLCNQLLPRLAKDFTQAFRDHSINIIV